MSDSEDGLISEIVEEEVVSGKEALRFLLLLLLLLLLFLFFLLLLSGEVVDTAGLWGILFKSNRSWFALMK